MMKGVDKKIKILVLYEKNSGGESIAVESVLGELRKKGDIRIKAYPTDPLTKTSLKSYLLYIFSKILINLKFLTSFPNFDFLIFTTFTSGFAASVIKLIKFPRLKTVWYYQGNRVPPLDFHYGLNLKTRFTQFLKHYLVFGLHKLMLHNLDLIIVPSSYTERLIKTTYKASKNKKFLKAYNAVDLKKFYPLSKGKIIFIKKRLNLPLKDKIISFVGRIDKNKGLVELIQAFQLLEEVYDPGLKLIIAYNKIYKDEEVLFLRELKNLTIKLGVADNIIWLENFKNLNEIYNVSDLIILPTKQDSFPLVIQEALATYTMVSATNVGGIKEILNKIDERLLIKYSRPIYLSQKMKYLLDLPQKQKEKILMKGYEVVKGFTWKDASNQIYKFFTQETDIFTQETDKRLSQL